LLLHALRRPIPPPLSSGHAAAELLATAVEELLAWEGELMQWEEALAGREDKARISKQNLIQVSAALDVERAEADAAR
jgi:hypothetical protein